MNWFVDRLFGGGSPGQMRPGPYGYANPGDYDRTVSNIATDAEGASGRSAPTMQTTQLNGLQQDQARQAQWDQAQRLGQISSGQQRGAGEMAVNRQLGQAAAAQISAARSARGANAALAYRNSARNQADLGLAGAGQAQQAQMADQSAANQQLAQAYAQIRGQDLDYAGANAQLGQAAQQENLRAQLAQTGMNDQRQQALLQQQLAWQQAPIDNQIRAAQAQGGNKGMLGGILGAAGLGLTAYSAFGGGGGGATEATGGGDDAGLGDGLIDPYGNSGTPGGGTYTPGTTGTGAPIGGGGPGTGQSSSGLTSRTAPQGYAPQNYNYQLGARYRY